MLRVNYDFIPLEAAVDNFMQSKSASDLMDIRKELNKFFKDSKCIDIIYTKNTDKLFFGMRVYPRIENDVVEKIVFEDDEKVRFNNYIVELDSKLFDPFLDLSFKEMTALLLHEVGHVVNDATPVEEIRNSLASYLSKRRESLIISDTVQYKQILIFGMKQAVNKMTSIFYRTDKEIIADEFVIRCGYGMELENAYNRIVKFSGEINRNVSDKFSVLAWSLSLYKNVKLRRIGAIHTLNKCKVSTASKLEKQEIDNMIRRLNQIDDSILLKESTVFKKTNEYYSKMKYKGMRTLEDEYFEYALMAKNIDEQDEALRVIRQINTRISIIDDFIATDSENMTEKEAERWDNLMKKYMDLRDQLAKKNTYVDKYYGLFVPTPIVKSRYEV